MLKFKKIFNKISEKNYLLITCAAHLLLSASFIARYLLIYDCMPIVQSLNFKYFLLCSFPFHRAWIMEAISCFFNWKASSVLNNVWGCRIKILVLETYCFIVSINEKRQFYQMKLFLYRMERRCFQILILLKKSLIFNLV